MGHRAYYLDETQDGWNVYYSNWGAKDLFSDERGDDAALGANMTFIDGKYELDEGTKAYTEVLNTDEPFEDLVMKYSHEEALFIRYLGQEDYTGYRTIAIMPNKDYKETSSEVKTKNGRMRSSPFLTAVRELEKLAYNPKTQGEGSSLYVVNGELEHFLNLYPQEYILLIPINTNRDAKAFEWLNEGVSETLRLTHYRNNDAVLMHTGTSHPLLDSMQERYKELQKSFEPTGYTVKQLFESACEHYAKLIDIRAEYLFWLMIYPHQMRTMQHIPIENESPYGERAEQLTTLIPSFSPVAGIDIESDYGIVNAPYMSDFVFISPFSRGGAKTMMNLFWNQMEKKAITSSSTYPTIIISELKKQNLWS
jgi:hypothetical protein